MIIAQLKADFSFLLPLLLLSFVSGSRLKDRRTEEDYLDVCLDGLNHKSKPGPESELFQQCTPWASRSCCNRNTTQGINQNKNFLNFNWDHCGDLSMKCRQYFIQDLCFYECSPNVGPWLVEDVRKIRNERYQDVPLCQSQCHQWWDACKEDFTCVENWAEHFNWSTGINTCPTGSNCRPFSEVYSGPEHFCENLFGPSFKVVPDAPGECFYMWFSETDPNPNDLVAKKKVASLLGNNSGLNLKPCGLLMILAVKLLFLIVRL